MSAATSEMESIAVAEEAHRPEAPPQQEATRRHQAPPLPRAEPLTFFGKHRIAAALAHLNNQINIGKEELEQLETVGEASLVCKEVLSSVESMPDPLLPTSKGPADANWDRWFGGAHNSRNHKRWI